VNCNCIKDIQKMASNATKAAGRVVRAAVKGEPIKVSPPVYEARLAVCRQCPRVKAWEKDPQYLRCTVCLCWLNAVGFKKAALATESCPEGRWP